MIYYAVTFDIIIIMNLKRMYTRIDFILDYLLDFVWIIKANYSKHFVQQGAEAFKLISQQGH